MRDTESGAEFAHIWSALPKIFFSRTLRGVEGYAWLAGAPQADERGLVDELRLLGYRSWSTTGPRHRASVRASALRPDQRSRSAVSALANSQKRAATAGSEASALRPIRVGRPRRFRMASGPV